MVATNTVQADEKKVDWREKVAGNYGNRIREWSSPEKIFSTFATVKKSDGEYYMTLEDFCNAILPYDYRPRAEHTPITSVPEFIQLADLDEDKLISFGEYMFFTTLLSIPEKHFVAAFHMFDLDGDGTLSKEEFQHVMHVLREESPFTQKQRAESKAVASAGLFAYFFGEDGSKSISFDHFVHFMRSVREGVMDLEFQRYANKGSEYMSPRNFAMSVVGYGHPKHVPLYLKRVESLPYKDDQKISKQEFIRFNKALDKFDEIALAVKLYTADKSLGKADFKRAVSKIAGVTLTDLQVDIIFHVFDRDGDGKLDSDELIAVMKKRASRGMSHYRDIGFARFVGCANKCFRKSFLHQE
ncbi:Calcium uptake protein 1, mitochondrial, variant 2 [Balamuthia mandrillaris]